MFSMFSHDIFLNKEEPTSESSLSLNTVSETSVGSLGDTPNAQRKVLRVRTLAESLASNELRQSSLISERRKVGFDTIEIREHSVILGCNPGAASGAPITISWKSLSSSIQTIDDYEADRPQRRPLVALRKTKTERSEILRYEGFSSEEVRMAEEHADSIRRSRMESAAERSDLQAMLQESRRKRFEQKSAMGKAKKTKQGVLGPLRKGLLAFAA